MTGRRARKLLAALLLAGTSLSAPSIASAQAVGRHALTQEGMYQYEYEALIHQLFGPDPIVCGQHAVCHYGWYYSASQWKALPGFVPEAGLQAYTYTFANLGPSTFHLMPSYFELKPLSLGITPGPVMVNGRYVACNTKGTVFLVYHPDGTTGLFGADLNCESPSS